MNTSTETDATTLVAAFVVNTSLDGLPAEVVTAATRPLVDTVAVFAAGIPSQVGETVLRYARSASAGGGDGWVLGNDLEVPAETAALVNGAFGHALDYDDSMSLGGGHLSVPVLAALLSLNRSRALPGPDLLEAFIIGYEVTAWTAKALGRPHYRRGWHVTSTAGSMGATAAVAKLLGFDTDQVRAALGVAASMASGLQRNFGTMAKPLHSGIAARNGVQAAQLVQAGLSAAHDVLDGPKGFLNILGFEGEEPADYTRLGQQFALVDPGPSLKQYPCCYAAHRSIEAMLKVQSEHDFSVAQVEGISCSVPTDGLIPLIHPEPHTGMEAKVSLPYLLATAFVDRGVSLDAFTDEAIKRSEVFRLMERTHTQEEARCRPEDPENRNGSPASGGFIELTVRAAGRQAVVQVADVPGSPANPTSWGVLERKFIDCLPNERRSKAEQFLPRIRAIRAEADVRQMLRDLCQ